MKLCQCLIDVQSVSSLHLLDVDVVQSDDDDDDVLFFDSSQG